jgi:hypothetical protein
MFVVVVFDFSFGIIQYSRVWTFNLDSFVFRAVLHSIFSSVIEERTLKSNVSYCPHFSSP